MHPWRSQLVALTLMVSAAVGIHALRGRLYERFVNTKVKNDVFALPPSKQVVALSLGYRSALADLIFAHVLVSSGIHFAERRRFEFVAQYLETVNELDPKFEAPYLMADSLITLQIKAAGPAEYRATKRILDRGMAQFPYSQALWASSGQFFAYLGPAVFDDPKEQEAWKLAGGRALARACELLGSNDTQPRECVVAAGLLTQVGALDAARQLYERAAQMTDDPQQQRFFDALLDKATGTAQIAQREAHRSAFQQAWKSELGFASRGTVDVLGPSWDAAACASADPSCPTSWRAWAALQN